jgi:hypothetical protein
MSYLVASVLWLGVGYALGYATGRVTMPPDNKRRRAEGVVLIVVVLCSLASVAQGYVTQDRLDEQTACTTEYANQLSDVLRTRFEAAEASSIAQAQWLRATLLALDEPGRVTGVRTALREYVATLDRTTEERRQNPYPEPPAVACPTPR